MFKNYYGKTIADQQQQLVYVANGSQLILLSIQICGGEQDGVLILTKYNNSFEKEIAFQQKLTILKNNPIVLQHKIILPTNYSFSISGSVSGISVCLNGVLQYTQNNYNIQTSSESQNSNNSI